MTAANVTTPVKEIRFNRADKDFAHLLNGEIVGYAPTYLRAEEALNACVYQLLARENVDAADLTPEEATDVLEAQRQIEELERMKQAEIEGEIEQKAYTRGREQGQRAALRLVLTRLKEEQAKRQVAAQAA